MRVLACALAIWATGVANGINSCLDPQHESYQCASGATYITLTEDSCGDGLTDSDVDDVAACFDNTGRTSVTKIDLSGNQLASLPAGLFNGLDALQEIYLSSNQLASLPVGLFNGLDALLSILLHDNQLASLPAGLLDGLDSLVFLSLYGNQLTSLPAGLFNGPDGLQSLYLNDNQLASLPAGLFDGLDSLSILNLRGNDGLQCLPSLTGSPGLTDKLYLPDGFEEGVICSCPSLGDDGACESDESCTPGTDGYICSTTRNSCFDPEYDLYGCEPGSTQIDLDNCGIGDEDLEDLRECFENVGRASVTYIAMNSNSLTELPGGENGLFAGFESLKTLGLVQNNIKTLYADSFEGLGGSLTSLYLYQNQLTTIPVGSFDNLAGLYRLALYDNDLAWIPAGVFRGLGELRQLYLSNNALSTLPAGLFDGLGELTSSLDLSDNEDLQCVPSLAGSPNYSAEEWNLPEGFGDGGTCSCPSAGDDGACASNESCSPGTDGYICSIVRNSCLDPENDLYGCEAGSTEINLSNCGIGDEDLEDLVECFDNVGRASVTAIWLGSNSFTSLAAGLFDGFDNIKSLSLGNLLTTLPLGLFDGLASLSYLYLGGNQFTSLPAGVFDGLESLLKIFLQDNPLTSLPAGLFNGLDALEVIYQPDNQLTSLPAGIFGDLKSLQGISLQNNQLASLPAGLFDGLDELQYLALYSNQLASLPAGLFDGLGALETLSLNVNQLTSLPAGIFEDLDALENLNLGVNQLASLPAGLFDGLHALQYLSLRWNDGLQCLPSLFGLGLVNGAELFLPDGFESGGECACPSLGDDGACDSDESCTPGTDGYVCSAVRNSCFDPDYDLYGCEPGSTLIDLDNCGIGDEDLGDLEECFNNVGRASVTTISMNYNSLTELPGGEDGIFAGFDSLNTLMLNQNNIETLYAESFEGLGGALTSLSIIQSRLTTIPVGCFDNLVGLQTMTLYGNDLAWLPVGAFRGLGELGTLSLAGNALSTLPAGLFDGMEGLTVLNLSENEDLQCVPSMEGSPNYSASEWSLPEGFGDGGMCSCPSSGDHGACESDESCSPGMDGYICSTGQSDIPSYLGCFSDPFDNRVFEWKTSTAAMTAEVCSELCSNSAFYGTQYSTECWCGDNVGYADNGPGVCDMSCSGNSDEICGGSYALSIYSNEPNYLGCYSDPADNRIFELVSSSVDMTAEVCLAHCSMHQYYGTQYSIECWCGDNADYDANGAGDCDKSCSGDSSEVCGGSYSMSVYKNVDVDTAVESYHLGCYSDPADNRVFVQNESSDAMTAELCASLCAGSAFYGTQYSTECWCGDINAPYSVNGEGVCDMTCSGNPEEPCGGSYSMDVYAHDPSYLGCFSDPADGRVFVRESSTSAMTVKACATLCTGSAYYGTQYSQECWCGDNADYDASGFGVCNMSCSGNSDEMCGGSYTMSVYQNI